jgi:EAL and modified HD-GYP domain-containing signal transduction protein
MSEVYVARQPIFDGQLELWGYELLFRRANESVAVVGDHDAATSTVVINAFTEIGIDRLVGDRAAWLNVSRDFVVSKLPLTLPPRRIVLELLENQPVDQELIDSITQLRRLGYTIALDDFTWDEEHAPLIEHVGIVKIDLLARDDESIAADVERLRGRGLTLLAEKVETREDYRRALDLGFDLAQGYFFCEPETISARGVAPNRLSVLELVAALQDPWIGFDTVETLIGRDIALSYRLLRYINSAFFGLRKEVSSIGRAIALLGLENIRRWATLTAFAGIEEKPLELITTALVRARFCELVGGHFGESNPEQAFTLGLFSVVDALMDAPMAEVLRSIPFPEDMTNALVAGHGSKGQMLECAVACERGRLEDAPRGTATPGELAVAHSDALAWATDASADLTADADPVPA